MTTLKLSKAVQDPRRFFVCDFAASGKITVWLNCFSFCSSVSQASFYLTLVNLNGPSHQFISSRNILTESPGRISYLVVGGGWDRSAVRMHSSDEIYSTCIRRKALTPSFVPRGLHVFRSSPGKTERFRKIAMKEPDLPGLKCRSLL